MWYVIQATGQYSCPKNDRYNRRVYIILLFTIRLYLAQYVCCQSFSSGKSDKHLNTIHCISTVFLTQFIMQCYFMLRPFDASKAQDMINNFNNSSLRPSLHHNLTNAQYGMYNHILYYSLANRVTIPDLLNMTHPFEKLFHAFSLNGLFLNRKYAS